MRLRIRRIIKDRTNYINKLTRALSPDKETYPKAMLISVPKCGTHLAENVLLHLGLVRSKSRFAYSLSAEPPGEEESILLGIVRPVKGSYNAFRDELTKVQSKEYSLGHMPFSVKALQLFRELGFKTIVILRDPRDQVISLYHWFIREGHPFSSYLATLKDPEERLLACIKGWSVEETGSPDYFAQSVADSYKLILPWLSEPDCLMIRFEDLIGSRGAGSDESQRTTIKATADHLHLKRSESQIARVARRAFDTSSLTFRAGQIGGWRDQFTDRHVAALKAQAGSLLVDLGYEKSLDW